MSPELGDIYRGNKATDFQPETRNPQSDVGGNLQPIGNTNLQPGGTQSEGSQQFPSVQQLKVLGVENPGSATERTQTATASQAPPVGLLLALGVLVVVAAVVAWLARPKTVTSNNEPTTEPEKDPPKKASKKKTSRKKRKNK